MAKLSRKKGATSQIFHIFIQDSSATTGVGKTGLAYNTASLVARYINAGGTLSASITLEDITTLGTYQAPTTNAHMRFKEVSGADPSKGLYEIHVHNDWMNLSGGSLVIMLAGAVNMAPVMLEIDLQADVNVTHWLGTACATPTVAGVPAIDVTKWRGITPVGGVDGVPTVNLGYINSNAQSVLDLKDFVDYGYDPVTNKVEGVKLADTCTVNSDMRGTDNAALASVCTEARLAELGATNLPSDIDAILADTAVIGAAGAGLTALPWNAAWDAEVQSECTDALNAYDSPTNTEMVAAFTEVKGSTWATTDTLEAIRDRGDSAWITAAGFATHSAADIWSVATRSLTDKEGFRLSAAGVDDVLDEVVENTLTLRQLLRLSFSALAGKSAGGGTTSVKFRDHADSKDRITATVDATGNRTAVTLNAS